jgi:hypothetical protein
VLDSLSLVLFNRFLVIQISDDKNFVELIFAFVLADSVIFLPLKAAKYCLEIFLVLIVSSTFVATLITVSQQPIDVYQLRSDSEVKPFSVLLIGSSLDPSCSCIRAVTYQYTSLRS